MFDERQLELLAGIGAQSKLALTNARSFESLERTFLSTVEALANALEAKDEYTSSHARWIRDMAIKVGEELGLDASGAEARRARGAVPRHRQDRDSGGDPHQAGPAHRRGAAADRDPPRARRADPRSDRAAGRRPADRPRLPRAVRRQGLPRSSPGRRDPARGPHHLRLRRLPRDDDDAALSRGAARRGSAEAPDRGVGVAVRSRDHRGLPARARGARSSPSRGAAVRRRAATGAATGLRRRRRRGRGTSGHRARARARRSTARAPTAARTGPVAAGTRSRPARR